MATDNVTSIDAGKPPRPSSTQPTRRPKRNRFTTRHLIDGHVPQRIVKHIKAARKVIFHAHSIAAVAAAAAASEMPADEHCTETELRFVSVMLDQVAAMLDPTTLSDVAAGVEVSHGDD